MKLLLAFLPLVISLTHAFIIPQHGIKSTNLVLNAEVNNMWAFDVYGRDDGELPSQEIMYVEGDPWYFNPRGGISQSDFYPAVHAGNRLQTNASTSTAPPPPQAPVAPPMEAAPQAPPLPAGETTEPIPEMEMPKVEESQVNV